jgi:Flp pilus assembly protein TadG
LLPGSEAASAVEFALLLPVLAICICGIIDFGYIFLDWNLANEASREAARYAATNKSSGNPPNKTA